jgi:hypothetical protein
MPVQELKVKDRIDDIRTFDLDGDGREEIIVLGESVESNKSEWFVSIFFEGNGGTFQGLPDKVIECDSTVSLLSTGLIPGSREGVISYLAPAGLGYLYPERKGAGAAVDGEVEITSPVLTSHRGKPVFFDFMRDWNGDGWDEVLVPDYSGFSMIMPGRDGSVSRRAHIDAPPALKASGVPGHGMRFTREGGERLVARYMFPWVKPGDYDGDGRPDLFILDDERILLASQLSDGSYSDPVPIRNFVRLQDSGKGDKWVEHMLTDINGDGLMDLSNVLWKGTGLSGTEVEARLFIGRRSGGFRDDPDQVIKVADALPDLLFFKDLDGDGKEELVIPTMKLGIMSFVRILTSGVLKIKVLIFDDDPNGVLEAEPRFVHPLTAHFDFSGTNHIASGLDDFNGDGKMDLVFGTKKDEISVFRGYGGRGNRMFGREPVRVIHGDATDALITSDLDGDGKGDIILYHPRSGSILVYFSAS